MPKVFISEKDRMCQRLSTWIYGKLRSQGISQTVLAKEMEVSQQALSYKLRNHSFTYRDLLAVVKVFNPDETELKWLLGSKGNGLVKY